jgi:hypothetical protein
MQDMNQTPNEKIEAVRNLKTRLETDFVELGQLLSEIKAKRIFNFKGYDSFKEFVQTEFALNLALCNKLIRVYDLYINKLDMSEEDVKDFGFEKLSLIAPVMEKVDAETRAGWLKEAYNMSTGELQDHIKALNKKAKALSVKDVLVEQFVEKMCTWFNCSKKEMMFKLALFFSSPTKSDPIYMEAMRADVKALQRKFEQVLTEGE